MEALAEMNSPRPELLRDYLHSLYFKPALQDCNVNLTMRAPKVEGVLPIGRENKQAGFILSAGRKTFIVEHMPDGKYLKIMSLLDTGDVVVGLAEKDRFYYEFGERAAHKTLFSRRGPLKVISRFSTPPVERERAADALNLIMFHANPRIVPRDVAHASFYALRSTAEKALSMADEAKDPYTYRQLQIVQAFAQRVITRAENRRPATANKEPTRRQPIAAEHQPSEVGRHLSPLAIIRASKHTIHLKEAAERPDSANQREALQMSNTKRRKAEAKQREEEKRHEQELQIQEVLGQVASQFDEMRDDNGVIAVGFKQKVIRDKEKPENPGVLSINVPKKTNDTEDPSRMTRIVIHPGETDDEVSINIFAGRKRIITIHKYPLGLEDGTVDTDYNITLSGKKTGVIIRETRTKARISNLLRNIERIINQGENKDEFGRYFTNAAGLWLL